MASQQDLQQGGNYPTHFLSIERQTNICSFTHSPSVSFIISSSLEYMNEFLVDIFQLYYLVAMVTKTRCTVRNAKFSQAKVLSRHIIIVEIDLLKCL